MHLVFVYGIILSGFIRASDWGIQGVYSLITNTALKGGVPRKPAHFSGNSQHPKLMSCFLGSELMETSGKLNGYIGSPLLATFSPWELASS